MANRVEPAPFDQQLTDYDHAYDEYLDYVSQQQKTKQEEERQPCGHLRSLRSRFGKRCFACEVEALREAERPEEYRKERVTP